MQIQPAELKNGPKTPDTNFGAKKCRRKKIWVQPAEPNFLKKTRVELAQLEIWAQMVGSAGWTRFGHQKFGLNRLNPICGLTVKLNRLTPNFGTMIEWNPLCPVTRNLGVEPAEPRGFQNTFKRHKLAWTGDEKTGVDPTLNALMMKIDRDESHIIRIETRHK